MVAGVYTSHIGLGFKLKALWYNHRGTARSKRSNERVNKQVNPISFRLRQ